MNRNKKIEYIQKYCTGCGLCSSEFNTQFKKDKNGFPTVEIHDENLDIFEEVCPIFYYKDTTNQKIWGSVYQALIGFSSDKEIRYKAASGGALTSLCIELLSSHEVDAIIHTTFDPNDPTRTITCISVDVDELVSRCGSRYSISSPLENINSIIEQGKRYAFVGKPCDVMALRRRMKNNGELQKSIIFLLSFFCAGEPSIKSQNELINAVGTVKDNVASISYRGNGWPGFYTVKTKAGDTYKIEYSKSWGLYLGRDIRYTCRFCLDGTGDAADVVCADFWELNNYGKPDFSEHEGRNIIISRSEKGNSLLNAAIKSNRLTIIDNYTERIDSHLHLYQPGQYMRKCAMRSVVSAMKCTRKQPPIYNKNILKKYSSRLDNKTKMRYFIGTIKRVIEGKI